MKSPLSLKMRAITLLSQREHSPNELRRKLMRIGGEMAKAKAAVAGAASVGAKAGDESDDAAAERSDDASSLSAEVDTLLTWLKAQGYLSEARFVESRIHARASRFGSARIKQELSQHGLSLSAENQAELRATEGERARAIWQRKFGNSVGGANPADNPMDDLAQRAKQIRFLTARGFSPDVVRRVIRSRTED